jgi:hypothetical protein
MTVDAPTLALVATGILCLAFFIWLGDEVAEAPGKQRREIPPSDETTPWGDVIRDPRAEIPFRHGSGDNQ